MQRRQAETRERVLALFEREAAAVAGPERIAFLAEARSLPGTRHDTSHFPRLVLGWINADFDVQIRIFQQFSRSTRKSSSREQILQISAKIIILQKKKE